MKWDLADFFFLQINVGFCSKCSWVLVKKIRSFSVCKRLVKLFLFTHRLTSHSTLSLKTKPIIKKCQNHENKTHKNFLKNLGEVIPKKPWQAEKPARFFVPSLHVKTCNCLCVWTSVLCGIRNHRPSGQEIKKTIVWHDISPKFLFSISDVLNFANLDITFKGNNRVPFLLKNSSKERKNPANGRIVLSVPSHKSRWLETATKLLVKNKEVDLHLH